MRESEPIASLPVGSMFTTPITRRVGVVMSHPTGGVGINVQLDSPDEDKCLHPEVRVLVGDRRKTG